MNEPSSFALIYVLPGKRRYQILSMAAVFTRIQALPDNTVATLHRSELGKVELVRCNGEHRSARRREFATHLHFTLPLSGCFVWHADREDVFADPTTLLCTHAGDSFRMSHPHGGDQSIVLSPSPQLIDYLTERFGPAAFDQRRRMRIAPARAQWIAHTFHFDLLHTQDAAAADECLLQFFENIVADDDAQRTLRDEALARRVLDYVHDTPETRLTLQHIANALQVRAPYLTHAFARHTGQPLYRYVMSLKLTRALFRIAAGDEDLTRIALDLGFSSHSHLSAAFKARYGRPPSTARRTRGAQREAAQESDLSARLKWRPLCAARGGSH